MTAAPCHCGWSIRIATVLALICIAACGDGPTPPDSGARLIVVGYLEVGYPLGARLVRGTDTTALPGSKIEFALSDPVSVNSAGGIIFLAAGTFTLRTTDAGATISTSVTIGLAPKIIFDMVSAGNRDIYRATIYGTEVQRLTTDGAVDLHPTGAKNTLVFTSYRNGGGELYSHAIGAPVGLDTRLSTTVANETDATLSPDGLHLAYTRDDGNTPRVYVADANNANAVALTTATGATVEGSPSWRFSSDSLLIMSTSLGTPSIFRVSRAPGSTAASAAKPATADSVFVEPAWSVDGTLIAYAAGISGGASRIVVRNRATNVATIVTPATMSAGQPVFLADGRVVFTIFASGSTSLAWVDPANPQPIFPIPLSGTDPQHPAIMWP